MITFDDGKLAPNINERDRHAEIHHQDSRSCSLKHIASVTRAEYFNASTADDLAGVYRSLQSRVVLRTRETELTALAVAVAGVLSLVSAGLSLLWFQRVL